MISQTQKHLALIVSVFICLSAAVFLRFHNLSDLSMFFDEGGNILTSIDPLTRAKIDPIAQARPLLAYQFKLAELLPIDPLLSGRITVALLGCLSALLAGYVTVVLFGTSAGLTAVLLWAICPFLVFHDRLALQDGFTSFFVLASLACAVRAGKKANWQSHLKFCACSGLFLGFAFANKITAVMMVPPIIFLVLFIGNTNSKSESWFRKLIPITLLLVTSAATLLAFAPHPSRLGKKLGSLGHTPVVSDGGILTFVGRSARTLIEELIALHDYLGLWFLLVCVVAILIALYQRRYRIGALWILYLFMLHLNAFAYSSKLYPRYMHPDFTLLIPAIAASAGVAFELIRKAGILNKICSGAFAAALLILVASWTLRSFAIAQNVNNATLPAIDRYHYIESAWNAGGALELYSALQNDAADSIRKSVVLGCEWWCTGFYRLRLWSMKNPNIEVIPLEINEPRHLLAVDSLWRKYDSQSGSKTPFYLLFEPTAGRDKYSHPHFLNDFPFESHVVADVIRPDLKSRYILERVTAFPHEAVLNFKPRQNRIYPDSKIGPLFVQTVKASSAENVLIIEASLPEPLRDHAGKVEIRVDGEIVGEFPYDQIKEGLKATIPLKSNKTNYSIEVESTDWFIPQFIDGTGDRRLLSLNLNRFEVNGIEASDSAKASK